MKLLLDENLPHALRRDLPGHTVISVRYMRWNGLVNGALLRQAAEDGFDALLTCDANVEYQQNMGTLPCSVIVLHAESNASVHLVPLMPAVLAVLAELRPRTVVHVG